MLGFSGAETFPSSLLVRHMPSLESFNWSLMANTFAGINPAASGMQEPEQLRMRQLLRQAPSGELEFCAGWVRCNQLDRGRLRFQPTVLGEEHGALLGTAQILIEPKLTIDNLSFPLTPGLGHPAPLSSPCTCGGRLSRHTTQDTTESENLSRRFTQMSADQKSRFLSFASSGPE